MKKKTNRRHFTIFINSDPKKEKSVLQTEQKGNSKDSKNEEIRVQEVGGPGRAWEFCDDQVGRRSRSPGHLLQEEALLRHHQGHPQYALSL